MASSPLRLLVLLAVVLQTIHIAQARHVASHRNAHKSATTNEVAAVAVAAEIVDHVQTRYEQRLAHRLEHDLEALDRDVQLIADHRHRSKRSLMTEYICRYSLPLLNLLGAGNCGDTKRTAKRSPSPTASKSTTRHHAPPNGGEKKVVKCKLCGLLRSQCAIN